MLSGIGSPSGAAGSAAGTSTLILSAALTRWPGSRIVRLPIATWPVRIKVFSRERDSAAHAGGEHAVEPLARLGGRDDDRFAPSSCIDHGSVI